MVISKNKFYTYILTLLIIFQDSIKEITHLSIVDYFDEVLILCFVLRALITVFEKKEIPKLSGKLLFLTSIFWMIGILSCLVNSSFRTFDLVMGSILMIKLYLLIISLIIAPLSSKWFAFFLDAILFLGKICFITGVFNFLFPKIWTSIIPYTYEYERNGFPSAMGLFVHAGQYGWFMLLVAIIYYAYYRNTGNRDGLYKFILYAIGACMSMKVKVFVGIIGILLFDTLLLQKKKLSSNTIVISLIGVILVWLAFGNVILDAFNMYFTDSSGSARFALLSGSLKIFKDFFPLGVGFSKFGSYYPRIHYSEWYYKYGLNTVWGLQPDAAFFGTDTFWPAIIGETGAVGLIVYVVILYTIYMELIRRYEGTFKEKDRRVNIMSSLSLFVFIQALVESAGEAIFNSSPQNIVIGLIVGSVLAMYYTPKGQSHDYEQR